VPDCWLPRSRMPNLPVPSISAKDQISDCDRVVGAHSRISHESYSTYMSTSPVSPEDVRAAAEAHRDLGPEYSDAVVASFLDKVDREVAARVEARMAGRSRAEPASRGSRRTLVKGIAIGACASALVVVLAAGLSGGSGPEQRPVPSLRHVAAVPKPRALRPGLPPPPGLPHPSVPHPPVPHPPVLPPANGQS
jgi:hypothetical protein